MQYQEDCLELYVSSVQSLYALIEMYAFMMFKGDRSLSIIYIIYIHCLMDGLLSLALVI